MDTFSIIQNFFTRMACRFCGVGFAPEDVQLVGEGEGYYLVRIHCHDCGQHNGDAAVGVEAGIELPEDVDPEILKAMEAFLPASALTAKGPVEDPEITEEDRQRLASFEAISDDDVLNAHSFIQNLDSDWMKFIPPEMRQRHTAIDTE